MIGADEGHSTLTTIIGLRTGRDSRIHRDNQIGLLIFDEMLNEWPDIPLIGYNFNPASKNVLMDLFFEYAHSNRVIIPANKEVRDSELFQHFFLQMINLRKTVSGKHVYLERDVTKTTSRDDFPDSLFLMLYAAKMVMLGKKDDAETLDDVNLFGTPAGVTQASSIEDRRKMLREGTILPNSLKNQRQRSLFS